MTAYSFGNRWVGIIALRDPGPAGREPLHRMALRLRQPITVAGAVLDHREALALLARVRHRYALRGDWSLVAECDRTEDAIRVGQLDTIRVGLASEMGREEERRARTVSPPRASAGTRRRPARKAPTVPRDLLVPAPPSPSGLAPLPHVAFEVASSLGVPTIDVTAQTWLRWALLHASYINENDLPGVNREALEMLSGVARRWLQVAVVDEHHRHTGDLVSPDAVHSVARASYTQVLDALSTFVREHDLGLFGRGERAPAGHLSSAAQSVATQVLGALCLATGGHGPATAAARRFWAPDLDVGTDWVTLVQTFLGYVPELATSSEGPDHAKSFTVNLADHQGRCTSGTGTSIRLARREAHRAYAYAYARHAIPAGTAARSAHSPSPLRAAPGAHSAAVSELARVFDLPSSAHGLLSETLVHKSWVHEHRAMGEASTVRPNATLAALGALVAPALVGHHFAVATLSRSLMPDAEQARLPAVPAEHMAELAHALLPGGGALFGNGVTPGVNQHAEVAQAVLGAAWLAGDATLDKRQPVAVSRWLARARNTLDAASLLERLCASIGCPVDVTWRSQGAAHEQCYQAAYLFGGQGGSAVWSGPWAPSKSSAKIDAAASALDLALSLASGDLPAALSAPQTSLLAQLLWSEVAHVSSRAPAPRRDVAARRLGVDLVAAGNLDAHGRWAAGVESVLAGSGTLDAFTERVADYYRALLTRRQRAVLVEMLRPVIGAKAAGELSPEARRRGQSVLAAIEAVALHTTGDPTGDLSTAVRDACAAVGVEPQGIPTDGGLSAPGAPGIGAMLVRLCAAVAGALDVAMEVALDVADGDLRVVIRVEGADLPSTLADVLEVVRVLVPQVRLGPQDVALVMVAPAVTATTTKLGDVAITALAQQGSNPWLAVMVAHLRDLLDSDDDTWDANAQCVVDHLREPVG